MRAALQTIERKLSIIKFYTPYLGVAKVLELKCSDCDCSQYDSHAQIFVGVAMYISTYRIAGKFGRLADCLSDH